MTAIIVEDNDVNFLLVREIIRPLGWDAHQVALADRVKESISRLSPDLIIMDISLPDGNGLDLTKELRQDGVEVPIVVMSAHAFAEMGDRAHEAGATAFFPKPFSLTELEQIISDITSKIARPV